MKRLFKTMMILVLTGSFLVGCNTADTNTESGKTIEGSLESIMEKIQEPLNLEIMTMGEAVDLSDSDSVKYNLGLDSNKGIKEAYVSNGMMSQAYAITLVRVENEKDAKSIAESMVKGVDPMKWICALADDVSVAVYGDLILLVMTSTELGSSDAYFKSFEDLAGSNLDTTIKG